MNRKIGIFFFKKFTKFLNVVTIIEVFSYIPNPFCVTALFPEYLSPPHHFHVCILRIVAISLRSHLHSVSTSSFKRMLILYFTVDFPVLKRPLSNGKRNILQELSWILAEEYVFVWSRSFHHWEQSSRITYNYSSYLQHTVIHVERENDFTLHSSILSVSLIFLLQD